MSLQPLSQVALSNAGRSFLPHCMEMAHTQRSENFITYTETWRIGPKYMNDEFTSGSDFSSDGTVMVMLMPATVDCFGHTIEIVSQAGRRRASLW